MSAERELQRQNERLDLLLNLTSRITSSLDLREVLRSIAANIREVILADAVVVGLPDAANEPNRVALHGITGDLADEVDVAEDDQPSLSVVARIRIEADVGRQRVGSRENCGGMLGHAFQPLQDGELNSRANCRRDEPLHSNGIFTHSPNFES
jgi:nitrate/nitrite-specific signal transduction histidine kinase